MADATVELVGPFTPEYRLTVGGYRVPGVSLHQAGDSETTFNVVFGGVCVMAELEEIQRWIPLVAHVMARSAGFTCLGEGSEPFNPFHEKMVQIESAEENP